MARWRWLLAAALVAPAISSVATVQAEVATAQAEEENVNVRPVSIDEIPAPARDTILSQVGAGTLGEVLEVTGLREEPVYVGRINQGKRKGTVWVDAAGNLLAIHRVV
ncbi:MAG TPA: hypothetical protein VMI75_24090 [Polyangiaceae bacterium]|nr:hypothetical protein [Polyangiaceae bacterium]